MGSRGKRGWRVMSKVHGHGHLSLVPGASSEQQWCLSQALSILSRLGRVAARHTFSETEAPVTLHLLHL